jgi:hypothetical protein
MQNREMNMSNFGKTNGELMLEEALRESRFQQRLGRIKFVFSLVVIAAGLKYLFS